MQKPELTVGAALLLEQVEKARDWLLEAQRPLEIRDFHAYPILDSWQDTVKKAHEVLDGYTGHVSIHGPDPCITFAPMDPAVTEIVKQRFKQALAACDALGAGNMVIHSPFIFNGNPFLPHKNRMGQDELFERAHRTLDEIVPLAEQINCTLVIENVWDKSPALLLELIRSFESEHVQLCLDVGHAHIAHVNGGPPPDYWIREAGTFLKHVHLHDTDGYYDRHWQPGVGNVNWEIVFRELHELDFAPVLIFEVPPQYYQDVTHWFRNMGWAK